MKISRTTCTAFVAAATSASAFSIQSSGGRSFVTRATSLVNKSRFPVSKSVQKGGAHMTMLFGNLFGGGAYNSKIDYQNLDHPGPELATAAEAGLVLSVSDKDSNLKLATFAGGCFWGLELAYQRVPGVVYTGVGYAQGPEESPSYEQVCSGSTGHTEAVIVYYDPKECSYESLLDCYFDRIDPTTVNGQGGDRGTQYRTGVYFHSPEQEAVAKARFEQEAPKFRKPIASELKAAAPFWPAEKYHQQYLEKGGRSGQGQNAAKGAKETIRCYG